MAKVNAIGRFLAHPLYDRNVLSTISEALPTGEIFLLYLEMYRQGAAIQRAGQMLRQQGDLSPEDEQIFKNLSDKKKVAGSLPDKQAVSALSFRKILQDRTPESYQRLDAWLTKTSLHASLATTALHDMLLEEREAFFQAAVGAGAKKVLWCLIESQVFPAIWLLDELAKAKNSAGIWHLLSSPIEGNIVPNDFGVILSRAAGVASGFDVETFLALLSFRRIRQVTPYFLGEIPQKLQPKGAYADLEERDNRLLAIEQFNQLFEN